MGIWMWKRENSAFGKAFSAFSIGCAEQVTLSWIVVSRAWCTLEQPLQVLQTALRTTLHDPPVNVDIDVEHPPIVDDFPDETIGFPQFFVCLPQGRFVSQISSSSAQQLGWDDENPGTESEDGPVVSFSKIQDPSGIKVNQVRLWKSWYYMTSWLVVWNMFYFPFHIWDNPSHLLSYVSEGLKPPTIYLLMIYTIWLWLT